MTRQLGKVKKTVEQTKTDVYEANQEKKTLNEKCN